MSKIHKGWLGFGVTMGGLLFCAEGITAYAVFIMSAGMSLIAHHSQEKKNWVGVILSILFIIVLWSTPIRG